GHLVGRDVEVGEEVGAGEVERGREERDTELAGIGLELEVLVAPELERLPVRAVRGAEARLVVVRAIERLTRVEVAVVALLELDGVRAALCRRLEHVLRLLDRALVVVADLRDDV